MNKDFTLQKKQRKMRGGSLAGRGLLLALLLACSCLASAQNPRGRSEETHWTPSDGFNGWCTITAQVFIDGVPQTSENLEVGAFIDDECRASWKLEEYDTDVYVAYLAVLGNYPDDANKTIAFQVFDHTLNMVLPLTCTSTYQWADNASWGDYEPVMIEFFNNTSNHDYVDLGLPSGLLWATCNVGADTPEDYGDYFAWGETQPKDFYGWSTYQYCNWNDSFKLTKYCNSSSYGYNGFTDNLTTLLPEDDAATANLGSGWRMPTREEWQELYNNTTVTWAQQGGVNGSLFTASNGNSLFLPAAGGHWPSFLEDAGSLGYYLSSSLDTDHPLGAWNLGFGSGDYGMGGNVRCYGFSVRPVLGNNTLVSVTATPNPAKGGTVTGGGTYQVGQSCTLTATANNGYSFTNWTENGSAVSTEASYTFTVNSDRDLVANFTFNGGGSSGGSYNGHAYVDLGLPSGLLWATCNVGAETPEDYGDYFAWGETQPKEIYNWSTYQYCNGNYNTLTKYCSISNYGYNGFTDNLTTLLPEDDAATANWGAEWHIPTKEELEELYNNTTHTWTTQNGVKGRLFTAANGNSLFLPAAGYRWDDVLAFAGKNGNYWSSSLGTDYPYFARYLGFYSSGSADVYGSLRYYGFSVRPVRENNTLVSVTATPNPAEGGTVSGGGAYAEGAICTLTATASAGYTFINWTENGEEISTDSTYTFTVLGNRNLVANFMEGYGCHLTINLFDSYGDGWNGNKLTVSYEGGYEEITLNGGSSGSQTLFVPDNVHITLGWIMGNFTWECSFNLGGANGDLIYYYGEDMNGDFSYEFDMDCDGIIITTLANPEEGGAVTGNGGYTYGQTCTLTATANEGYTFMYWTENGNQVSTNPVYSFTVTGNRNLVANFMEGYGCHLMINLFDSGGDGWNGNKLTVSYEGGYEEITLNRGSSGSQPLFVPDNAHITLGWIMGNYTGECSFNLQYNGNVIYHGENMSGGFSYEFDMDCDGMPVITFTITATANPAEGGTISGAGEYDYYTECTLTATANEGYAFNYWEKNGEVVSPVNPYTFNVIGDSELVANFVEVSGGGDHAYVDLGLPSGLLWATCNIGAYAPEGYGDYFAWGDTQPEEYYDEFFYLYFDGADLTKYTGSDGLTILLPEDDAATANWGVAWRMPTVEEWQELIDNTTSRWKTQNGVIGRLFTAANGNNLFLPAAGYRIGSHYYNYKYDSSNFKYIFGEYWSRSLQTDEYYAFVFDCNPADCIVGNNHRTRCYGCSVRPVRENNSLVSVTATSNPAEGGTVSGEGTYAEGTGCMLTATPAEGYTFINWAENGEVVSVENPYTFTVAGDRELVANFEGNHAYVTATSNPADGGTISGAGAYVEGVGCTLIATPAEGYTFINWTENGYVVSVENPYTFTVAGDRELVANFEGNHAYVDLGLPSGLLWATCNIGANTPEGYGDYFAWGETQPKEIYWNNYLYFDGTGLTKYTWNDGLTILLPEDDAATANWGAAWRMPTVEEWQELIDNTISMWKTQNGVVGRLFTAANGNSLFLPAAGRRRVSELSNAGNYGYYWSRSLYDYSGYAWDLDFDSGDCYMDEYYLYYRNNGFSVRPVRENTQNTYTITATANPIAGGSVTGAGTYNYGQTCTLTATPATGYTFVKWTKNNGTQVSTSATYTFTVNETGAYVAHFSQTYTITATANPTAGGTVTGAGTYNYGQTCTLTATPATGYTFVKWTKNGIQVSTSATYTFTVNETGAYVAHFSQNTYTITATANPTAGGTVTGAGTYDHFSTCTLAAIPNTGYHFVNWTMDGEEVSTEPTYSFEVTGAAAFVANFELNSYAITATVNPTEGGTVTGAGTYGHFSTCTLAATPNTGYHFVNWTMDGEVVTTDATYSFTVMESASYVANFVESFVVQTTNFAQGWNWWSTYIEQEGIDGLTMLEEGLGSNGYQIKSQTDFVTNYGSMWFGMLGSIDNEETYMIDNTSSCQVVMTGAPVTPSDHPITVSGGWNWIGYPCTNTMSVSEAFSGYTPANGDQVKSQSDYAMYFSGMWIGQLQSIAPGTGLMYLSNNATSTTLVYPDGGRSAETPAMPKATHWTNDIHAYPHNMTVMAVVELDDVELTTDNYELSAFDANGECRGSAKLVYVEPLNRHVAFLTIAGDDAAELNFGLYNVETGREYFSGEEALVYVTNATIGNPEEPYVVRFRGTTGMEELDDRVQIFPNPVQAGECISINIADETKSPIRVEIVNAMGVETLRATSVQTPAMLTAPSAVGVYTMRITVEGKGTVVRKLVVK